MQTKGEGTGAMNSAKKAYLAGGGIGSLAAV